MRGISKVSHSAETSHTLYGVTFSELLFQF